MALKPIRALLSSAEVTRRGMSFDIPPNAELMPGATNLFTLPGASGLLFKKVPNMQSLDGVGGGVAYISADGKAFAAYIGETARKPLELGDGTKWPISRTPLEARGPGVHAITTQGEINSFPDRNVTAGDPTGYVVNSCSTDFVHEAFRYSSAGGIITGADKGADLIDTPVTSCKLSGTLGEHKFIAAVVSGAKAGFVIQYDVNAVAGWQSSPISLGKRTFGMAQAMESILAGADGDYRPYLLQAYTDLRSAGAFDDIAEMMVTTYYRPPRESSSWFPGRPQAVEVGLAIPGPQIVRVTTTTGGLRPPGTWYLVKLTDATIPTVQKPALIPDAFVFAPEGIPASTLQGVAAWHRMGDSAPNGRMFPLIAPAPSGGGWSSALRMMSAVTELDDSVQKQQAALQAANPSSPAAPAGTYGPSGTVSTARILRLFGITTPSPWLCGTFIRQYHADVQAIYNRAEALIRQG